MTEPKPSAWLYEYGQSTVVRNCRQPHFDGYTERPLFTREAIEAEIVAWLRDDADQTEIEARAIVRNTTGNARQNAAEWAELVAIKRGLASAIERGEYRSKSDG